MHRPEWELVMQISVEELSRPEKMAIAKALRQRFVWNIQENGHRILGLG